MRAAFIAIAVFFADAGLVLAQDEQIDCENAIAQSEMNICAARDYEAADKELNAVWQEARTAAKEADAEQPDELKGADEALLAGQRGWIAYRDGQCALAGFEVRGGSMEPMVVSACKAELTRARTRELRETLLGEEPQ